MVAATATPVVPVPVATVTLISPLPIQLTFYEENSSIAWKDSRQLWYNAKAESTEKATQATDWSLVLPAQPATITGTEQDRPEVAKTAFFTFSPAPPDPAQKAVDKLTYSIVGQPTNSVVDVQTSAGGTSSADSAAPAGTTTPSDNGKASSIVGSASPTLVSTGSASASASASTSSSSTLVPSKDDGIQPAAAAGIGVGCFLAGLLIAGLLAWCLMKRRRSAGGVRDSETSTVALMHREKGPVTTTASVSSGSPIASALGNGLPQPLEDKAISGEISKISNLIKNHIQSYYHSRAVSPGMIDYDDLQALGENLPVSVGTLSTLLNNSATREIALRFCLAWVVTSRIRLNDSSNTTFLPPEVAKCMQSMNHIGHESRVHSLFYTKWRALTSELLQPTYVRNPFSAGDGRVRNIQAAATLLDSVLRPFADSRMDDGARSRNLEEILKRSAQFAFTLFSQPTAWDFDWENEQGVKSGNLCIFPALVQVMDENGEPIHPPRPFSEAVNRRLDE